MTDIPITKRQVYKDGHLSMSLWFFSLQFWIGSNDTGLPFQVDMEATMCLLVPGFKPTYSVLLGKYVTAVPQALHLMKNKLLQFYQYNTLKSGKS